MAKKLQTGKLCKIVDDFECACFVVRDDSLLEAQPIILNPWLAQRRSWMPMVEERYAISWVQFEDGIYSRSRALPEWGIFVKKIKIKYCYDKKLHSRALILSSDAQWILPLHFVSSVDLNNE